IAWLDRLPTRQGVDIAVDAQTLEDPYWASQRKGVRVLPRPGRVAEMDFPVVLTSEIDGTVYLIDKAARRGIGDVLIELLDNERQVVSSVKSGSDGYYIVPAVVQGRYFLRVSPEQLKQFELIDPGERAITIAPDGKFINGVEFLLHKK
ncbi:MAG TPA: carboxypeptidase-like regulatory domain-containing protein, partial [Burkholderiaceae bacterium]|nr:carboxypeptidase-like regulatory domain-containing protein [Burkholderiaceae bacterium]